MSITFVGLHADWAVEYGLGAFITRLRYHRIACSQKKKKNPHMKLWNVLESKNSKLPSSQQIWLLSCVLISQQTLLQLTFGEEISQTNHYGILGKISGRLNMMGRPSVIRLQVYIQWVSLIRELLSKAMSSAFSMQKSGIHLPAWQGCRALSSSLLGLPTPYSPSCSRRSYLFPLLRGIHICLS